MTICEKEHAAQVTAAAAHLRAAAKSLSAVADAIAAICETASEASPVHDAVPAGPAEVSVDNPDRLRANILHLMRKVLLDPEQRNPVRALLASVNATKASEVPDDRLAEILQALKEIDDAAKA